LNSAGFATEGDGKVGFDEFIDKLYEADWRKVPFGGLI